MDQYQLPTSIDSFDWPPSKVLTIFIYPFPFLYYSVYTPYGLEASCGDLAGDWVSSPYKCTFRLASRSRKGGACRRGWIWISAEGGGGGGLSPVLNATILNGGRFSVVCVYLIFIHFFYVQRRSCLFSCFEVVRASAGYCLVDAWGVAMELFKRNQRWKRRLTIHSLISHLSVTLTQYG